MAPVTPSSAATQYTFQSPTKKLDLQHLQKSWLFMPAFATKYCEPAHLYFLDKDALLKKYAIQNSHCGNSVQ